MHTDADVCLTHGEHAVLFFRDDDQLVEALEALVVGAAAAAAPAVVVATAAHLAALESRPAAGRTARAAFPDAHLTLLDAGSLLARLLVGDDVDAARFDDLVGSVVRRLSQRGPADGAPLRVFGEMVGLLWESGNVQAALHLEELWTGLLAEVPCSLLCAYPSTDPGVGGDVVEGFAAVCARHDRLVRGAPAVPHAEVMRRFPAGARSARAARAFATQALTAWGLGAIVDDARVVVTELVTNAVRHAGSDLTVALGSRGDGVRISVGDAAGAAAPRAGASHAGGGRGLQLVSRLSSDWGWERVWDGKIVWADVPAVETERGPGQATGLRAAKRIS